MQHIEYIDLIVSPLDKIPFCQGGLIIHKFDMLQKGISILLNLLKKIVSNKDMLLYAYITRSVLILRPLKTSHSERGKIRQLLIVGILFSSGIPGLMNS